MRNNYFFIHDKKKRIEGEKMKKLLLLIFLSIIIHIFIISCKTQDNSISGNSFIGKVDPGNFIDNDDGTISDRGTGRVWTKCSIGQEMTSDKCKGIGDQLTFDLAKEKCENLSLAGYDDWRLPDKKELKVLVKCTNRSNAQLEDFTTCGTVYDGIEYVLITIDTKFFPNTPAQEYWTSEEIDRGGKKAWTIYFKTGYTHYQSVNSTAYIRCIR